MNTTIHTGSTPEHRLAVAGWGLFFLWLGVATLAGLANWIVLVGIGVVTLGIQAARKSLGLDLEAFWLAVGLFFGLGGAWELSGTTVPLLPVLLILVGGGVVASAIAGRKEK